MITFVLIKYHKKVQFCMCLKNIYFLINTLCVSTFENFYVLKEILIIKNRVTYKVKNLISFGLLLAR